MTTSYSLHLTRHESGQDRETTIAQTITEEPALMAAVLRAAADRLDPPQPAGPVYRDGGQPAARSALDAVALAAYAPVPLRDSDGQPNYAHDAGCNTRHDAGPGPCPPPRCGQPGHGTLGCDCTPVVVDDPGARMDAPDAALSPAVVKAITWSRPVRDNPQA